MGFVEIGVILFLSVLFVLARKNSVKVAEQLKNMNNKYADALNK
jgi:hypothetical protein